MVVGADELCCYFKSRDPDAEGRREPRHAAVVRVGDRHPDARQPHGSEASLVPLLEQGWHARVPLLEPSPHVLRRHLVSGDQRLQPWRRAFDAEPCGGIIYLFVEQCIDLELLWIAQARNEEGPRL